MQAQDAINRLSDEFPEAGVIALKQASGRGESLKIFKYELADVILLPAGSQVLTVQVQNSQAQLWALVDESQPTEERRFLVVGTGHHIDGNQPLDYIATWQQGIFVWHCFEVTR